MKCVNDVELLRIVAGRNNEAKLLSETRYVGLHQQDSFVPHISLLLFSHWTKKKLQNKFLHKKYECCHASVPSGFMSTLLALSEALELNQPPDSSKSSQGLLVPAAHTSSQ